MVWNNPIFMTINLHDRAQGLINYQFYLPFILIENKFNPKYTGERM